MVLQYMGFCLSACESESLITQSNLITSWEGRIDHTNTFTTSNQMHVLVVTDAPLCVASVSGRVTVQTEALTHSPQCRLLVVTYQRQPP